MKPFFMLHIAFGEREPGITGVPPSLKSKMNRNCVQTGWAGRAINCGGINMRKHHMSIEIEQNGITALKILKNCGGFHVFLEKIRLIH
jgi:hypothetical protein